MEPPQAQQSPDGSLNLSRLILWVKQIATHGRMARAGGTIEMERTTDPYRRQENTGSSEPLANRFCVWKLLLRCKTGGVV